MRKQAKARAFSAVLRMFLTLSLFTNLNACTLAGRNKPPPIPQFKSVAIVNKGVTDEMKARFGVANPDSNIGAGAATGAVLAGAGTALICGPFIFLCAISTVTFAAAGAVGGGLAGAAADAAITYTPPNEQLLLLDNQFVEISQSRTIHQEIEESLTRQIPPERVKDNLETAALLQFRLYDVRFSKTSGSKYALTLKTVMLFKWNRDTSQPSSTHRIYEQTSQALPLEAWVEDEGETLNQAFDTCIAGLTEKMAADIQFHQP